MHLHSIKYHNFDCIGVLIGKSPKGKEAIVEEAVPLFHQRPQTGLLEIAFDMIESLHLKPEQKIVGLYEAAMPINLPEGREQSHLAQYICEQITGNCKDPVFIAIKPDFNVEDEDDNVETQLQGSQGLVFKKFSVNHNGSIAAIEKSKVHDADCVNNNSEHVLKKYVNDKQSSYIKLYDFDDHFADVQHDWRNQELR